MQNSLLPLLESASKLYLFFETDELTDIFLLLKFYIRCFRKLTHHQRILKKKIVYDRIEKYIRFFHHKQPFISKRCLISK